MGAQKAATSTVFRQLEAHPDVYIPPTKELSFFWPDFRYAQGAAWYAEQFSGRGSESVVGEATPYLHHPEIASRVSELLPEARFIAVLR